MKKFFVMLALAWGTVGAFAQNEADSVAAVNNAVTLAKEVYPQKEEDGDLYHGLTRKLTFDRMIPPYGLEVTYGKTTHIIFPSSVRYVDLGSPNLIAGKADGAENVIRVKTTVKDFREETNMSVITESGSFYTFNVKYAEEPLLLNIEMKDFIHDGSEVNRPNNALDIYLKELGCESPKLVHLISKSIHKDNRRHIKHIGSKAFGIQYLLRGLYTHNGLLYFHTQIKNRSNVPYEVDFVTFKIVDKKLMKRTAIQEQVIFPLRAYDYVTSVAGKKDGRTVFVFDKFTIPSDKVLMVEMHEKGGGRHQTFTVESEDIVRAGVKGVELRGGFANGSKSPLNYYTGFAVSGYTPKANRWVIGAEYLMKNYGYRDASVPRAQFTAEGGYYLKFLSDPTKTVFLSVGGSALAGYETVNWGERILYDGSRLLAKDAFVYGGAITLELEAYVADRIVLLAAIRERVLWGSSLDLFTTQFGLGVKFIIH